MAHNLKPSKPLSQVIFIHDYLQFIFRDEGFNVYNLAEVDLHRMKATEGQAGCCDTVVALVGQRVVAASHSDTCYLRLSFEEGAQFIVRSDDAAIGGPEAFEFSGENQPRLIKQNGVEGMSEFWDWR